MFTSPVMKPHSLVVSEMVVGMMGWGGFLLAVGTPPEAAGQAPDFSKGFEMMVQLGLPDTKGWKYVRIEGGQFDFDQMSYVLEDWKPTGNAWMDPASGADGPQKALQGGLTLAMVGNPSTEEEYLELQRMARAAGMQPAIGEVADADEAADAASLTEAVVKALETENKKRQILGNRDVLSGLFFQAAHWHRRGLVEPSSRLMTTLMEKLPRKAALLESALNTLANHRQKEALIRFEGSRDWKKLESDLAALLTDFPRMWVDKPLAERLLERVRTRASGDPAPVAADGEFLLTPEQVEWWRIATDHVADVEETGLSDPGSAGQLWSWKLLPWPEEAIEQQGWRLESLSSGLFDLTKEWDWIAVMGAALGDETLTTIGDRHFDQSWSSSGYRDPSEEPEELTEEEIEENWNEMERPKSRDEVARAFLEGALPGAEQRDYDWWRTAEVEEIRAAARSWQAKLAGRSDKELIQLYLDEGSDEQKQHAATLLAQTGSEEDLARLEELVLRTPQQGMQIATEIVKRKREAGAAFLATYAAKLKEEWQRERSGSGGRSADDLEEQFDQYFGRNLKGMEAMVSGKGFAEILEAFVAGEIDQNEFGTTVQMMSVQKWQQPDVEAVFAAIEKTGNDNPSRQSYLLNVVGYLTRTWIESSDDEPADEIESPADNVLPNWLKAAYGQLVEKGAEWSLPGNQGADVSVSRMALYQLDALFNPAASQEAFIGFQGLPEERMWAYVESRGRARLAGGPVPAPPKPEDVPEARREELKAGLKKLSDGGWPEFVAGLNAAEQMVLRDELAKAEPDPKWNRTMLTLSEVISSGDGKAEGSVWETLKGSALDATLAKRLLELCQAQSGGAGVMGGISSAPLSTGIRLFFTEFGAGEEGGAMGANQWMEQGRKPDEEPDFKAVAFISWQDSRRQHALIRLLGTDGNWKTHEGEDAPKGFYYFPFGEGAKEADFEASFAEFIEKMNPGQVEGLIRFGVLPVPEPEKGE